WLRAQGYWVDVLPYEKLSDDYLRDYTALVLAGAEHLSAAESATVLRYAERGGLIVGDTLPGYFDEHHRVRNAIAVAAGAKTERSARERHLRFEVGGANLSAMTMHGVTVANAKV